MDVAVIFTHSDAKAPSNLEDNTRVDHLVVKFACLVVKMRHLVVILRDLVVKITGLVVIVKK